MTAFSLVMLGKLILLFVFVDFLLLLRLYAWIQRLLSLFNLKKKIFRLLRQMSTRCSSFILVGRKVALAERRRHNDRLIWSYDLMFANYYESKFTWRLTFSLDLFSCYLNSSAQRSVGYLISQRPLAFLTSSKWPTQQTMLRLLDSVNANRRCR